VPHPFRLERIHHIELLVGNARQAAYFYRKAFGFGQIAYMGPETGTRGRASYVVGNDKIRLVLTSPLSHEDARNVFLALHGDAVKDLAFEVDDAEAAYREVVARGAEPVMAPAEIKDRDGSVTAFSIKTFGDTIHTFVSKKGYGGVFLPGYEDSRLPGRDAGLLVVDHVVGNVEDRQMDRWCDWYVRTLGFHQFVSYDDKDISTEFSALRSKVMASSPDRRIKLPINEPAAGLRKSQIQEYIDFNVTAGVQHIALLTDDILSTVSRLRESGVDFLHVPETYYETVWDRVGEIEEDREAIRKLGILVDRDETGYLLQLFTRPVQDRPTLFLEVIERRGCQSFGKGNFKALFESIEHEQARRGNL
jgi:4-hydroxyphenylpyruvate dioxygenase